MIHLTFQLIPLAIGLGIGYLMLIKSSKQEGVLEAIGKFLGWILIVASLLIGMVSAYYSIKIIKTGHLPGYYYRQEMMKQQQEQNDKAEEQKDKEEEQNEAQEEMKENQK